MLLDLLYLAEEQEWAGTQTLAIDVHDDVNETDAVTVRIPMRIRVSDDDAATEFVAVSTGTVVVLVADTTSPTEFVRVTPNPLHVFASDSDAAVDTATVTLPLAIRVSDADATTDAATVRIAERVTVFDSALGADAATIKLPLQIVVSDTDLAGEAATVRITERVVVQDNTTVIDAATLRLNPITVRAVDLDSPAEQATLQFSVGRIDVNDTDLAGEAASIIAAGADVTITVVDARPVTEKAKAARKRHHRIVVMGSGQMGTSALVGGHLRGEG